MIPVLDKGWIKTHSAAPAGSSFEAILAHANRGVVDLRLLELPQLIVEVRCPLFVQAFFAEYSLRIFPCKTESKLEAYVPAVPEIGAPDLKTNENIQASIEQISEALLLNPRLYEMDRCDKFVAQVNIPISVYTTIIVWGSLARWINVATQKGLPKPIEAYRKAVYEVITAEWPNINHYIRQMKR